MVRETIDFFGKKLTIETGRLAKQADGAALVSMGDTSVLVTVVGAKTPKEADFVPLTVEYLERTYSAGKIPGGYYKREGRPTESEILNSRIIDRPIRPLLPKNWRYETQIIALVLSADKDNDPVIPALIGASAALCFSDIPFDGPVAGFRLGLDNGEFKVNPSFLERESSKMDLMVAVGPNGVVMVEGKARFIPENKLVEALVYAERIAKPILEIQMRMAEKLGVKKRVSPEPLEDEILIEKVREVAWEPLCEALSIKEKLPRRNAVADVFNKTLESLNEVFPGREEDIKNALVALERERVRGLILNEGKRIDGRTLDEIRPITCEVAVLPRTHGSAIFQRGETQVVVTATLGTGEDEQKVDLLTGDASRSFMLHYNFPPFSVGEVKPLRGPSRRDIGHGHLAEVAIQPVLPTKEEGFLYTLRVVSEVLESNGSSSMATVCGSSLALMDAGVKIKKHVGGIAMGLIKEGDKIAILTDILGDEDHLGDMDFKVAGTEDGITAVQMDIKVKGLTEEILSKALEQARKARLFVIEKMKETIPVPRDDYSPYAPRITTLHISPDRIRDLIGPGGKNIKAIQSATGVNIEIQDNGTVHVASQDPALMKKAISMIHDFTNEAEIGKTYLGSVVKVTEFGAFVKILPGVEGLLHISELSDHRVRRVEDVVQEGDEVLVKVINIDKQGKIRLSRKEAMAEKAFPSNDDDLGTKNR